MMNEPPCCQSGSPAQADLEKVTAFLKVIDEPNRLKILCLLRHREQCVCDIWKKLALPQNLTSHHLKTLKDFGLIEARQEGRNIHYALNKIALKAHAAILHSFFHTHL